VTHEPGADWILATTNPGKLAEYRELLSDSPIRLDPLDPASIDAPEETGLSFVENALIKARHAARVSGRAAIADDSGLCVTALGCEPGVRSARYAGPGASDAENIEWLLERMDGIEEGRRQAQFHCVIVALSAPDDPAPIIATGRWPGSITRSPRGTNGFGYDPIFFDPELGLTAAELEPQKKNAISHRGRACRELRRQLARDET
jgi:XTP/dITP diphosphohydrolase